MTGNELFESIRKHPAVTATIPLELELQWPVFTIECGKLCARFYFCHTQLRDRYLRVDRPRFVGKFSYPFKHVVLLKDISFSENGWPQSPGWLDLSGEAGEALQKRMKLLMCKLDEILARYEKQGLEDKGLLADYHTLLVQTVPFEFQYLYQEV